MPDYMFLLESRLSAEQRAAVVRVTEIAQELGLNVYLTGGAVRDLITGLPIRDLDFTIEGNPARIAREMEKGGARILLENERLRHYEMAFHGDVDGSLAAARDAVYARPGSRPELRWSTVMEDLRRRDFTCNAIALSLNPASRGLLLDPTNGLSDIERREVRLLSMHGFTNLPIRLMRVLRYRVRLNFDLETRTSDWFALALERGLGEQMDPEEVGYEMRQLAREDQPGEILELWALQGMLNVIHPRFERREPDYKGLAKLMKAREAMMAAGYRSLVGNPVEPRLLGAVLYYVFKRLSPRERNSALERLGFRSAEIERVASFKEEADDVVKMLISRKTDKPRDAYTYLEQAAPPFLAFIQAEYAKPGALAKIRNFLFKWKPLRATLPVAELESLGIPRGPKFDQILENFFDALLRGRDKTPEERTKRLRKLAGIKPEPKKKEKEKEKKKEEKKPAKKGKAAPAAAAPAAGELPEAAPAAGAEAMPATPPQGKDKAKKGKQAEPAAGSTPAHAKEPKKLQPAAPPAASEKAKPAAAKPAAKAAPGKKAPANKPPAKKPVKKPKRR